NTLTDVVYVGLTVTGNPIVAHSANNDTIGGVNVGAGAVLTINGGSSLTGKGALPQVTVNGTINLGDASSYGQMDLVAVSPTTSTKLTGVGTLVFGSNLSNQLTFGGGLGTHTIDTNVLIRGQHGFIGADSAGIVLTNSGTIQADVSDGANSGITVR